MSNKILYFPYIRLPRSPWLAQMLLYWDQVGSIVPYEYLHEPARLGSYMQELLQQELVTQVVPGPFIHRLPRFEIEFERYLRGPGIELDRRRAHFNRGNAVRIHMEKMGNLPQLLVDLQLARRTNGPWVRVELETSNDFMAYLAATLGRESEIDSTPMTDRLDDLQHLLQAGVPEQDREQQLQLVRLQILDQILPMPDHTVSASDIRNFKDRYGTHLPDFRRRVERELIAIAGLPDDDLRQRQTRLFLEEAHDRIRVIQEHMGRAGWRAVLGKVCTIAAATPGVPQPLGLLNAIREVVGGQPATAPQKDFAYAAYASANLGGGRRSV